MKIFSRYPELYSLIKASFPSRQSLLLLFLLLLLDNGLTLLLPWFAGQVSELLVHGTQQISGHYQILLFTLLLTIIAQAGFSYLYRIRLVQTSERLSLRLRTNLYEHIQSLPIVFFHETKRGDILSLLSLDAGLITTFLTTTLIGFLPYFVTALGALFCLYLLNPYSMIFCFILIPCFVIATRLLSRQIAPLSKTLMHQYGASLSIAEENLAAIQVIKAFGNESFEKDRYFHANNKLLHSLVNFTKAQEAIDPVIRTLGSVVIFLILLFTFCIPGSGSAVSTLVSILLYSLLLLRPVASLAGAYGQTLRALAAAEKISAVLALSPENKTNGIDLPTISREIRYEQLSFRYPDRPPLFTNLSFSIKAKETVAITGENGAGKSTIVHLLLRFYQPQAGIITIDGIPLAEFNLTALRSQIAIVQQSVSLRNGTILDNLLLGKHGATLGEIEEACAKAKALSFIEKLPSGFHTIIGDQGVKLSGGQQQRLALARALLRNPAVIILDEATAMFDPVGEADFIETNRQLFKDKTVVIITHRPAALALADRIFKLERGMIKEVSRCDLQKN